MPNKLPPYKMSKQELIDWIYENDFNYWFLVCKRNGHFSKDRLKEIIQDDVYETIEDIVYCTNEYDYFIKYDNEDF